MSEVVLPMRTAEEDEFFSGYRIREERQDLLVAMAEKPWEPKGIDIHDLPGKVSFRGLVQTENQKRTNSCCGQGGSTGKEYLGVLKDRSHQQLSRWFCYITAQRISGHLGSDTGSTIYATAKGLQEVGICREELCPFTGQYYTRLPEEAVRDAAGRKLTKFVPLLDQFAEMAWIGLGKGPVLYGIIWTESMANPGPEGRIDSFSGRALGGHCVLKTGYCVADERGEWHNSHGIDFGKDGFFYPSFEVENKIARNAQTVRYGLTDLEDLDAVRKPVDWTDPENNVFVTR